MRVALALLLCAVSLVGCATQAPTPSPGGPGPTPAETATPTAPPSPTIGPPDDRGFPTSVLGLPTYTVAGISQVAALGALDGRFAAVAGYWAQFALPCPYVAHQPVLLGFCSGGSFADTLAEARAMGGSVNDPAEITVPETANGDVLWTMSGFGDLPAFDGGGMVVLIVHAADGREWQCKPAIRSECHARLVIDSVAWANGASLILESRDSGWDVTPAMTPDQIMATAVGPGEQLVTAYPLDATDLNEVDARFLGQGRGIVWYARVMSGTPDANGTADGTDVLIDDASGGVVATLPLKVDPAYSPARVVLDARPPEGIDQGQFRFAINLGDVVIANGSLDSSLRPLAMQPGDYTVFANVDGNAIVHDPLPCEMSLSLNAGADVAYFAQFERPSGCTWKEGSLFP